MRYAIFTAILALGLTGCNLNGVSFDTSALPSLNIDQVNCNNCNVNLNITVDDQKTAKGHHFATWETFKRGGVYYSTGSLITDYEWHYGSKEATDKEYGDDSRRVYVNGDLGLFIEYNVASPAEKVGIEEFYLISGGNSEQNYTPMPSGNYQYNGKLVTKSPDNNTIRIGTVNAEVNFTDYSMWVEFGGADIDRRFEDIEIDIENGTFRKSFESEYSKGEYVFGTLVGQEAKGLVGIIIDIAASGAFAAERSDTPVIAEN